MMDWIERRKELPSKDGMLVVVFDPTNHPTVWPAKWNEESQSFDSNGGWFEADEVTHWMPLPKAPKSPFWSEGFEAAEADEEKGWSEDFTHCPYQPTSPWTYPCRTHEGPPTFAASEWEAGYDYRRALPMQTTIHLKLTKKVGDTTMEFIL